MPYTAHGVVINAKRNVTAIFRLENGERIRFIGELFGHAVDFACSNASMTYESRTQIFTASKFTCELTNDTVKFTMSDGGPTFQGLLDWVSIECVTRGGLGTWEASD
ncbi:hypothetical protein JR316_0007554 [Psilocybe cubensis]|uniref:Uncharacterized protein n=1 Tax=Psilocybe cubensis TaxID=181762 RepID=A0ACB8GZT6_PSICU|nr:hypothetical protein JR316_0007554 [Psilocybe cubensis]KAH9480947.1 hypothetical protein JR316_0007554 [Psilocybe cubensis]